MEGYVESASSGLIAGINAALMFKGKNKIIFPPTTAIGALSNYIYDKNIKNFQPMNINFGIIQGLDYTIKNKRERNLKIAHRALETIQQIKKNVE